MKKSLFVVISLVAMLFTMASLTSCEKSTQYSIVMECACDIVKSNNISNETAQGIAACEERIDVRLVEMFGETFNAKTDEEAKQMDKGEFNKYTQRISKDSKIQAEIQKLHEFKTLDNTKAVRSVIIYFYSVSTVFGEYQIDLE